MTKKRPVKKLAKREEAEKQKKKERKPLLTCDRTEEELEALGEEEEPSLEGGAGFYESSEDEFPENVVRNTVGNVPMHWYDDYDHIGKEAAQSIAE